MRAALITAALALLSGAAIAQDAGTSPAPDDKCAAHQQARPHSSKNTQGQDVPPPGASMRKWIQEEEKMGCSNP